MKIIAIEVTYFVRKEWLGEPTVVYSRELLSCSQLEAARYPEQVFAYHVTFAQEALLNQFPWVPVSDLQWSFYTWLDDDE